MKRLISKKSTNNNQQIADQIYNNANEWLSTFTNEAANHIKKVLKNKQYYDLEEFFNDDYDVKEVMENTLKNIRDIFDGVFDIFYSNPSQRNDNNYQDMIIQVKDIISNFDNYGYDIKSLMNEKLKNELTNIW